MCLTYHAPLHIRHLPLRSADRIQEPIQRLVVQRPEQLIAEIRARTPKQALEVFKRSVEVQPIRASLREVKAWRQRRSFTPLAARRVLARGRRRELAKEASHRGVGLGLQAGVDGRVHGLPL